MKIYKLIKLLIKEPKAFLYILTYSNKDIVSFEPYNPKSTIVAQKLMDSIRKNRKDINVHYVGSTELKIFGHNDIDLLIGSPKNKFKKYIEELANVLGTPKKIRFNFVEWEFIEESGFKVDIRMDKLPSKHINEMLKTHEFLEVPENLEKYIKLKKQAIGKSTRQFRLDRLEFFLQNLPSKPLSHARQIAYFIIISIIFLTLGIRGIAESPTSYELLNQHDKWVKYGPFELSSERARFALTYSLVEDKSFYFSTDLARFSLPDLGIKDGKYVSLFAPGTSFLIIPGYLLGKLAGSSQLGSTVTISLFALINGLLIIYIAKKFGSTINAAILGALTFLFATPAFTYAVSIYQHHISTFLLLSALCLSIGKTTRLKLFTIWFICAFSIIVDYPNLFILLPLGLFNFYRMVRISKSTKGSKIATALIPFGIVLPIVLFFWFNTNSYNNPLQISGTVHRVSAIDEAGNPVNYENIQNKGGRIFYWFYARNLLSGFITHSIGTERGILFFTPVILLGILGASYACKQNQKLFNLVLGSILANILIYSLWGDPWGGWAFGSRYLIPAYALLSILLAGALTKYAKSLIFVSFFSILFIYSISVNTLGAITTSAIQPKIEVQNIQSYEKHSYNKSIDYLMQGNSKSFVYQAVLKNQLEPKHYFYLLSGFLIINGLFISGRLIRKYE